jgi:CMP-N-acetylneuraminic acid synthetase
LNKRRKQRAKGQGAMPSRNQRIKRKAQLLEQLDPKRELELEGTFTNHVVAAIHASSPTERQQAIDKAAEAYENSLDHALYAVLEERSERGYSEGTA